MYYLLFRLLSLKKNVAFQLEDQFLLFQDTGVRISNTHSSSGRSLPDGIWTLSDSHTRFEQPCDAFLTACSASNAWIVQTTSPQESNWRKWSSWKFASLYWMDYFSLDEMKVLG